MLWVLQGAFQQNRETIALLLEDHGTEGARHDTIDNYVGDIISLGILLGELEVIALSHLFSFLMANAMGGALEQHGGIRVFNSRGEELFGAQERPANAFCINVMLDLQAHHYYTLSSQE